MVQFLNVSVDWKTCVSWKLMLTIWDHQRFLDPVMKVPLCLRNSNRCGFGGNRLGTPRFTFGIPRRVSLNFLWIALLSKAGFRFFRHFPKAQLGTSRTCQV